MTLARKARRTLARLRTRVETRFARAPPRPTAFDGLDRLWSDYGNGAPAAPCLVFGDSVSQRVANEDLDRTRLSEMIAERIAPQRTCAVTGSGYHAGVYFALLRALERMPGRPATIVLPANLRSFSPQWAAHPAWSYAPEIGALANYSGGPPGRIPLNDEPDLASIARYHAMPVNAGDERRTVGDYARVIEARPMAPDAVLDRWRAIFTFHYMHVLSPEDARLRALAEAARLSVSLVPQVLVYSTPVNVEAGRRLIGPRFEANLAGNVATLARALPKGARFLDLSSLLPAEDFFHKLEPTEHLNEYGRRHVAARVAAALRAQH